MESHTRLLLSTGPLLVLHLLLSFFLSFFFFAHFFFVLTCVGKMVIPLTNYLRIVSVPKRKAARLVLLICCLPLFSSLPSNTIQPTNGRRHSRVCVCVCVRACVCVCVCAGCCCCAWLLRRLGRRAWAAAHGRREYRLCNL